MTPVTTSKATGFRWNSPVPYLFGGLAMTFFLVAFALAVLACSYGKSHRNASHGAPEVPLPMTNPVSAADMEPKIVVVMAGDDKPTFLAKPIS